ncbi:MAG: AraC family transcriptional regulator [Subdoligranulum sp.]|nr:AraC family transcriptional regulator [Subdoligranulum sp.]
MKKLRGLSLNLKLLACFLAAIFILSAFHLGSYVRLMKAMTREAETSANERMASAVARLDESFSQIRSSWLALTYLTQFRMADKTGAPSNYEIVELYDKADLYLGGVDHLAGYAILFRNSDEIITARGSYEDKDFFSRYYISDLYHVDFWRAEKTVSFSQQLYPATTFTHKSAFSSGQGGVLLPVAFKSYWKSNTTVVFFLDIEQLCANADPYFTSDFYLFSADGQLLYSSEPEPELDVLPGQAESLFEVSNGGYTVQRTSAQEDFICVKQLPRSAVMGQITNSLYISLFTALAALALVIAIAAVSIWRVLHPVQDILRMLPANESAAGHRDELRYIQSHVETMLRQREQYAQTISQKDAALSGFLLQSQLKNIYVELDAPDLSENASERIFHILYFRIHYRSGTLESISADPSAVSYLLMENLRQALTQLFDAALIFQLEPTQFVAKVGLSPASGTLDERMHSLLKQLDNERDYAFFTIVQSGAVQESGEFAGVYEQVLNAAQYALVEDRTQLLRLPFEPDSVSSFSFSPGQERQLRALVHDGHSDEAAELTDRILAHNLEKGIRHIHMILLCSDIVSAILHALTELYGEENIPNVNSSSVYNALPQCDTAQDYRELVSGFVRSAALCAAAQPRAEDAILDDVQAFLEKNYQREFSMDELAQALHLSRSYLSTYYKSKTGANISDRIQYFRIQKAVELLEDTKLRIADVGAMVGISNINTFLRQFKKYTGMTPKEYRMNKLSEQ